MNNRERNRLSKKQRRLTNKKWSSEDTDDKRIESNQLKNGTRNKILELEDPSKDQLEILEENSLRREEEIKELRQSISDRRKRRALKRDQTLEITSSAETETDNNVNKVKKVFEKDEILSSSSSNRARSSTNRSRNKSRKRKNDDQTNNIEIPITDILRKYEEPVPPTPLTADKIYVQGDNGFSTIKIITKEDDRKNTLKAFSYVSKYETIYSPIGIAILAQKFFKRTAFIYQGILGGMTLVHLVMTIPIEDIFDGLTTWKQINISKDFLALLGWFFVAIGIKEDALLLHLESMQGSTQTT
ncbi:hypothetical protein M0804_001681 [Polistes exclamans]|nr:hypothetical protein M0804_001681 [Polistes exclamans]